jgi:hypothetical protein
MLKFPLSCTSCTPLSTDNPKRTAQPYKDTKDGHMCAREFIPVTHLSITHPSPLVANFDMKSQRQIQAFPCGNQWFHGLPITITRDKVNSLQCGSLVDIKPCLLFRLSCILPELPSTAPGFAIIMKLFLDIVSPYPETSINHQTDRHTSIWLTV